MAIEGKTTMNARGLTDRDYACSINWERAQADAVTSLAVFLRLLTDRKTGWSAIEAWHESWLYDCERADAARIEVES